MKIIYLIYQIPLIRKLFRIFYFSYDKYLISKINKDNISRIKSISPENKILSGLFTNLQYPNLTILESTIGPKFLGVYEKHIQNLLAKIDPTTFSDIINIGSAEGYYSVGLAKMYANKVVICYEISEKDRLYNKNLAKLNSCTNLEYYSECNTISLIKNHERDDYLIISDCEGAEFLIFSKDVVSKFSKSTFIIELHPTIGNQVNELFEKFNNHNITILNNKSIVLENEYNNIFPNNSFYALSCEHRGGYNKDIYMEWAYITPKNTI